MANTPPTSRRSPERPTAAVARSLADHLRQQDDDQIALLLSLRPDLVHPVPPDLTALVSRASTSVSTARALDRLDTWSLQVAEVLAALPDPTSADTVAAALPVARESVDQALRALRDRALVWGDDGELHLVRAVREAVGSWPCGLYAAGLSSLTPKQVLGLIDDAPADAAAVIEQLLWGPPIGSVPSADRAVTPETARTPIEWLLARKLLVPIDSSTVALPREVALAIRGGDYLREAMPQPPTPANAQTQQLAAIDRTAGQSAFTFVRWVEDLLEQWSVAAPNEMRSGGLAVRDLAAAAALIDTDEQACALVIELAHAAGLLSSDEEEKPAWLPTQGYDLWLTLSIAERWANLASTWLTMPRIPALIGQRDEREGRINALSSAIERPDAPDVRRLALEVIASAPSGSAVSVDDIRADLEWKRPRRTTRVRDVVISSTVAEAELLGVTGLGALSTAGRLLLDPTLAAKPGRTRRTTPTTSALSEAIEPHLPTPLDHVLLQADLTVVAPGPLESTLAREVGLLADIESTGGATVYRLSADSLRRAFDAGRTAHDVLAFFESRSRTPVPQPLTYLIEDVARRHGVVRVGSAQSYVRCDDDTAISAILADKKAASLRPFRLAPGVLALQVTIDEALPVLRSLGLAPAAEAPDGTVVIRRPDSRRSPMRHRVLPVTTEPSAPDKLLVTAAVKALRAGDRIATGTGRTVGPERLGRIPTSSTSDTMAAVRAAIEQQRSLWIGYADTDGRATERIIDPIDVNRGFLNAYDHRYEEVRQFALARITGVADYEPESST